MCVCNCERIAKQVYWEKDKYFLILEFRYSVFCSGLGPNLTKHQNFSSSGLGWFNFGLKNCTSLVGSLVMGQQKEDLRSWLLFFACINGRGYQFSLVLKWQTVALTSIFINCIYLECTVSTYLCFLSFSGYHPSFACDLETVGQAASLFALTTLSAYITLLIKISKLIKLTHLRSKYPWLLPLLIYL